MFDAGLTEMMVIAVIALLVVGPERLPEVATKVGSWVGKARAFVTTTKADIEREFQATEMKNLLSEQQQEIEELRNMMSSAKEDVKKDVDEVKDLFENNIHSSITDVEELDKKTDTNSLTSDTKKHD